MPNPEHDDLSARAVPTPIHPFAFRDCGICLGTFVNTASRTERNGGGDADNDDDDDNAVALSCGHAFHTTCLLQAVEHRPVCPACRTAVTVLDSSQIPPRPPLVGQRLDVMVDRMQHMQRAARGQAGRRAERIDGDEEADGSNVSSDSDSSSDYRWPHLVQGGGTEGEGLVLMREGADNHGRDIGGDDEPAGYDAVRHLKDSVVVRLEDPSTWPIVRAKVLQRRPDQPSLAKYAAKKQKKIRLTLRHEAEHAKQRTSRIEERKRKAQENAWKVQQEVTHLACVAQGWKYRKAILQQIDTGSNNDHHRHHTHHRAEDRDEQPLPLPVQREPLIQGTLVTSHICDMAAAEAQALKLEIRKLEMQTEKEIRGCADLRRSLRAPSVNRPLGRGEADDDEERPAGGEAEVEDDEEEEPAGPGGVVRSAVVAHNNGNSSTGNDNALSRKRGRHLHDDSRDAADCERPPTLRRPPFVLLATGGSAEELRRLQHTGTGKDRPLNDEEGVEPRGASEEEQGRRQRITEWLLEQAQ